MVAGKGTIALMGSGELTATMVAVHRELLKRVPEPPRAVFLDTPAGFQLNVDEISRRAKEYFQNRIQQPLEVASFKSKETSSLYELEQALHKLRHANFILIGPGSPTYAVRQWQQTPIPGILLEQVEKGGCLVAASAAALTVGRYTLPVYEIYKVGEDLHWVAGLDLLAPFGFNLVVIPHWNNAEGGSHDTSCCFMGQRRFAELRGLLPEEVAVLGLDEHTACLMNLAKNEAVIRGIGTVTLWRGTEQLIFRTGESFPLDVLRGKGLAKNGTAATAAMVPGARDLEHEGDSFWEKIHAIKDAFDAAMAGHRPREVTNALLELDRTIWRAREALESEEAISQAREILRDLMVVVGLRLECLPRDREEWLTPLVEEVLAVRQKFREARKWREADELRQCLARAGILVEDTEKGPRWRLKS
ncbi:MAG: hypothetical protein JRJ12_07095 [Deltaproteobacteria bacterium]|nr:hypothetical protein [Deltaproteobacteria bacterium]MBW2071129.1 hypothetical protein [Deltaproteobacteria bacterium]